MAPVPVAVYGVEVPPGEVLVPAAIDFPATIRITMAALDPTAEPQADSDGNLPAVPRSTLKIIREVINAEDSDDEEGDSELEKLLAGEDSEEESDEEANGGPSDPAKSKKSLRKAAIQKLIAATDEESDDEMEDDDAQPNGKSKKGKEKASMEDEDEEEDSDDDEYEDSINMEDFVVCTLDTERNYQQPLDITIPEDDKVFFVNSGTHSIYLTGNYVIPEPVGDDEEDTEDEDDDEYDLSPDEDSELSDELDGIDGMERVQEIDTDEEEPPKLVETKKGKNKRPAEDEPEGLDEMVTKMSKKQQKKLKTEAAAKEAAKESPASAKKVQFAKELEQGPTGPAKEKAVKAEKAENAEKPKTGIKIVQGVTIDDRKIGTGRTVKNGDKVGMRYIGKLQNGKVFDANKKGPPFTFKVGKGEVIKGWDIGIAGMAVGGERRLTIPAHLAYGSKSLPGIPSNSTLIFDVKLLEIK